MTEKSNEYGINLSGGMKRRLCLGNAIIGNTKYLFEFIIRNYHYKKIVYFYY